METVEIFWLTIGDWHLDPQGGAVVEEVWEGLNVGTEEILEDWVFWLTIGDWHLEPQGEGCGDVAVVLWEGLDVEAFWLTNGD